MGRLLLPQRLLLMRLELPQRCLDALALGLRGTVRGMVRGTVRGAVRGSSRAWRLPSGGPARPAAKALRLHARLYTTP